MPVLQCEFGHTAVSKQIFTIGYEGLDAEQLGGALIEQLAGLFDMP